jgi:hypothetical protein
MTADLLMIVPTRGRPGNAARLVRSFNETSTGAANLLIAVDGDWPNASAYQSAASKNFQCAVGPWRGMVATLNHYADQSASTYPMLGFCGDDHLFVTPGWDKALVDVLYENYTGVAYGNDQLQGPLLPTAVALTSNIVLKLGYMAPPGLRHLYVDNFWLELGKAIGHLTYLPDVIIEHLHPTARKAETDASYDRVNSSAAISADAAAWDLYLNAQFAHDVQAVKALQ